MYALIYDEFDPSEREKKVISVHKTRGTAEKTLEKRQRKLGKRVWECIPESYGCTTGFAQVIPSRRALSTPGHRVKQSLREIGFLMGINWLPPKKTVNWKPQSKPMWEGIGSSCCIKGFGLQTTKWMWMISLFCCLRLK